MRLQTASSLLLLLLLVSTEQFLHPISLPSRLITPFAPRRRARADAAAGQAGKLPDVIVACVGGGSNAIGLFYPFIGDASVKIVGVEAGGEKVPPRRAIAPPPRRTACPRTASPPCATPGAPPASRHPHRPSPPPPALAPLPAASGPGADGVGGQGREAKHSCSHLPSPFVGQGLEGQHSR